MSEISGETDVTRLHQHIEELAASNQRISKVLQEAREQLIGLQDEVERLSEPPNGFGTFVAVAVDGLVDVVVNNRKMRVSVSPELDASSLQIGQQVVLNESMNVVVSEGFDTHGELATVRESLDDGKRILISSRNDAERVVLLAAPLLGVELRQGDSILYDSRTGFAYERVAKSEVEDLLLEEVPDITYDNIGGLSDQIEHIRDAVELPFLHTALFGEYQLKAPKGILLYGPPGCGKTLIAKAVANSLAVKMAESSTNSTTEARSYFLNIKGPELLNKYVGETERHIRTIFQKARERAAQGTPVIVFFDEMDALFRTRGTGVSSDVENTIVPQLLSEIDGVETLDNVIVIGASNREDMIDPAILRPGRLDVKIKIERPDAHAARDIYSKYLTNQIPLHADDLEAHNGDADFTVSSMIERIVEHMYATSPDNEFLEVTYANGEREVLYFKDFASGAMIESIVSRAKKSAIKNQIAHGIGGITYQHLVDACAAEFRENEDLPNTTNPDDWARISGKKGERIIFMRTLIRDTPDGHGGRSLDTSTHTS